MNKDWIAFHLREGLDELTRTIAAIEERQDFEETEFEIAMAHLYNHLNTAWNSRNADPERTAKCSDEDFFAWRAFPADIQMGRP